MRSDDLDRCGIEQDFLVRLAKRCGDGILAGVDAPAREGDLAGMGAQMLAADRQDDAGLVRGR